MPDPYLINENPLYLAIRELVENTDGFDDLTASEQDTFIKNCYYMYVIWDKFDEFYDKIDKLFYIIAGLNMLNYVDISNAKPIVSRLINMNDFLDKFDTQTEYIKTIIQSSSKYKEFIDYWEKIEYNDFNVFHYLDEFIDEMINCLRENDIEVPELENPGNTLLKRINNAILLMNTIYNKTRLDPLDFIIETETEEEETNEYTIGELLDNYDDDLLEYINYCDYDIDYDILDKLDESRYKYGEISDKEADIIYLLYELKLISIYEDIIIEEEGSLYNFNEWLINRGAK